MPAELDFPIEGTTRGTPIRLTGKSDAGVEVQGRTIRYASDAALYLSAAGGRVTSPPPLEQRLVLVPSAAYRITVEFEHDSDGEAVLWIIEFGDAGKKVAQHSRRLDGARIALTWHADPGHQCALVALRLRGRGQLRIERAVLQELTAPVLAADAPEAPSAMLDAAAIAPLDLPERFDPDRDFAVAQLELHWQLGRLAAVDLGAVRRPLAPRLHAWLERRQLPVLCRVTTAEDARRVEGHLLATGSYPIVVEGDAGEAGWLGTSARLHGPEALGSFAEQTSRRRAHALAHPDLLPFPPLPQTPNECRAQGFVIVAPGEFPQDELGGAKKFWKDYGVRSWYQADKPWTGWLARWVKDIGARRVLEFGCNVGRNLAGIRDLCPDVELVGLDINAEAIAFGREHTGLDLRVADEASLAGFADGAFDAVFTVSVLDHISEIGPVCRELLRVASRHALFFEVRLPIDGRVVEHLDHKAGEVRRSTGASYSWHVERYLDASRLTELRIVPTYLHSASLGPYYAAYFASLGPSAPSRST